jgi:hypothetical protein
MVRLALSLVALLALPGVAHAGTVVADTTRLIAPGISVACVAPAQMSDPSDEGETYQVSDATGTTFQPLIVLSLDTCAGVTRMREHRNVYAVDGAVSLATLLHEAEHLKLNSGNEALVECTAMHKLRFWLTRFGYRGKLRASMLRGAWLVHDNMAIQYTAGCASPTTPKPIARSTHG